jgi:hypothetical protein
MNDFELKKEEEEFPIIKNSNWEEFENKEKEIKLNNKILSSKQGINYEISNNETRLIFTLKGKSEIWCFLRTEKNFDEFTVVIKVSKVENSQRIFISLGTFINDNNGILILKIFSKEQLIDKSQVKNETYIQNDISLIKLCINDTGDENLTCNIFINDSLEENNITSTFFLPVNEEKSLMIAGIGECILKNIISHIMAKEKLNDFRNSTFLSGQRNSCNCCNIF